MHAPSPVLLSLAVLAAAGDWPDPVIYDGKPRDAKWLEAAYQRVAPRLVMADGKLWNLDEPQRKEKAEGAYRDHRLARVEKVTDAGLLCRLEFGGTVLAAARIEVEFKEGAEVLLTPNPAAAKAPGVPAWLAFPCEPRPLTRGQFVEAIRSGLQLFYVLPCGACGGDGVRIAPEVEYDGARLLKKQVKRVCEQCKGAKQIVIRSIQR